MQAVILAAGRGTRLMPLTENIPKALVPVSNKPMLEIILQNCIKAGLKKFYISVHYLKEEIMNYFGNGDRWGIEINYLMENKPLGTAGALGLLPERPSETLMVINGDVLTHVDFGKMLQFHKENKSYATICIREYETTLPYGVVKINESNVIALEEKPITNHYINAGIYCFKPDILDLLPQDNPCDIPQLIYLILEKKWAVSAFPIHEYWLDVGHPTSLEQANIDWG